MKALFPISVGLAVLAVCAAAQEHIPDAAPVDDGPLVANPEQDSLDMADMLYQAVPGASDEGEPAGICATA